MSMLKHLIKFLETRNPDERPIIGFNNPHSYRGYYNELAFEPCDGSETTAGEMLTCCKEALENVYQGWKGGDYTYDENTQCWLSYKGSVSSNTLGSITISLMFGIKPSIEDADI